MTEARHALITGGAGGLGLETARALRGAGFEVTLLDVNEATGTAAARELGATFQRVDLSRLSEVRAFADQLVREGRAIDVLINNAGLQPLTTRRTTAEGFELTASASSRTSRSPRGCCRCCSGRRGPGW